MPQLTAASPRLARVVCVLGAGGEGRLILEDLSLKENYTMRNCANHAITMTSLAMDELAQAHPSVSFIHTYPGVVNTDLTRDMGTVAHAAAKVILSLSSPWIVPFQESGERHLYLATNGKFGPQRTQVSTRPHREKADTVVKAYLVDGCGIPRQNLKLLRKYKEEGVGKAVWTHTLDVFRKVCGDVI